MNSVAIAGNLARDPESRSVGDTTVTNFTVAVNNRKKVDGEWKDDPAFVDCEAWGGTATFVREHFAKGHGVCVQGSLLQDRWEDKDTKQKRSKLKVRVDRAFFPPKGGQPRDEAAGERRAQDEAVPARKGRGKVAAAAAEGEDEIPF